MFQVVRTAGGWSVRSPLLPIDAQLHTYRFRHNVILRMLEHMRSERLARHLPPVDTSLLMLALKVARDMREHPEPE